MNALNSFGTANVAKSAWMRLSLIICLLTFVAVAGGCAEQPDLENGVNVYTTRSGEARLRIMEVDSGLSRQAQAGSLDLNGLPAGKLSFMQHPSGDQSAAAVPWVVESRFFFTQVDVIYADAQPAADGTYTVAIQFRDKDGFYNTARLQQMTVEMAAGFTESGETPNLAIINDDTVWAIVPVTVPITNGQIVITGLTRSEADGITADLWSRAEWLEEEGQGSGA